MSAAFYRDNGVALWMGLTYATLVVRPFSRIGVWAQHMAYRVRVALAARRLAGVPPAISTLDQPEGSWVRISGRVLAGAGFRSVGGWKDCVLANYIGQVGQVNDPGGYAMQEVHAVDFCIVVASNEIIHVEIKHAQFLSRPVKVDDPLLEGPSLATRAVPMHPGGALAASVKHQQVIEVGDQVVVYGRLHRLVDPSSGAGYRTPGLRLVLRGEKERNSLIRAL
jgi:hypothetical protein